MGLIFVASVFAALASCGCEGCKSKYSPPGGVVRTMTNRDSPADSTFEVGVPATAERTAGDSLRSLRTGTAAAAPVHDSGASSKARGSDVSR
jgi:hypothetical protein